MVPARVTVLVLLAVLVGQSSWAMEPNLTLFAIGDWGGHGTPPFTTPGEVSVAAGMGRAAERTEPNGVLALGDNFYPR